MLFFKHVQLVEAFSTLLALKSANLGFGMLKSLPALFVSAGNMLFFKHVQLAEAFSAWLATQIYQLGFGYA